MWYIFEHIRHVECVPAGWAWCQVCAQLGEPVQVCAQLGTGLWELLSLGEKNSVQTTQGDTGIVSDGGCKTLWLPQLTVCTAYRIFFAFVQISAQLCGGNPNLFQASGGFLMDSKRQTCFVRISWSPILPNSTWPKYIVYLQLPWS